MHKGEVVYKNNFGYCDVNAKVAPDSGIVYHLGSLTKFITCAAVAVLVEQGKLKWESKVLVVLPGFPQKYPEVEQNATLVDILAHRIALEGRVSYWAQMHNQLLLPTEKSLNVLGALASTGKFRKDLKHNKWTYGAAGDILEKLPGRL